MQAITIAIPSMLRTLYGMRYPNGLFSAARWDVQTGYHRAWIRDNAYVALCLEQVDPQLAIRTYHALLDLLLKQEPKIDCAIARKPMASDDHIHARFEPTTMGEVGDEWGNKQNDAIGIVLFAIGNAIARGMPVIRDTADARILQKLVFYLDAVEYWQSPDNGIWEDAEVLHASSIGACLAGLRAIQPHLFVPQVLIERGESALRTI